MSRILFALCIGLLILGAKAMPAQNGTYDANALRLEGMWGGFEVYRGSGTDLVGRPGVFRGLDVAAVVSASPNATTEARVFQQHYPRGILAISFGLATLALSHGLSRLPDLNWTIQSTSWLIGFVSTVYGAQNLIIAHRALSKSIWWYNRDLAANH